MSINPLVMPETSIPAQTAPIAGSERIVSTQAIATLHALPDIGVLRLAGRDAIAFAQAQFANDVAKLVDGQWQWNLWLSAKGRVLAVFALLRVGAEELIAVVPDVPATKFAQELTRFRFRSKVDIAALDGAMASGSFEAPAAHGLDASGNRAGIERDEAGAWQRIAFDFSGATPRTLVLQSTSSNMATDDDFAARWKLEDLAHGLPRLGPAQFDSFTPQMLGLERLHAFSVKKGCYPGQEIVARTHFLGQAKRGPVRLALNRLVEAGTKLSPAEGSTTSVNAEIIAIAQSGERIEALAVAPLEAAASTFGDASGIMASPLPLLDGLSR